MSDEIMIGTLDFLEGKWKQQAEQMKTCEQVLRAAPLTGVPPTVSGAANTFIQMWLSTVSKAKVAADVYAEEIKETGIAFQDLEAEIVERLSDVGGGM